MIPQSYPLYARVWAEDQNDADNGWWVAVIGWVVWGEGQCRPVFHDLNEEMSGGAITTWIPDKEFTYRLVQNLN